MKSKNDNIQHTHEELISALMDELQETNQGLMALTLELEDSRNMYQEVFDTAFDGLYQASFDGHYTMINSAAAKILGYKNATDAISNIEHIGINVYGSHQYYAELTSQLNEAGSIRNLRSKIQRPDGSEIWISENIHLLRGSNGLINAYQGMMRNISSEWKSEKNLQLLATVFEHGAEAIAITDHKTHILRVNKAYSRITGKSEESALGTSPTLLSSIHHDNNFYGELWRKVAAQGHWRGEIDDYHQNGRLYNAEVTISEVRNPEGEISNYILIFSDITERKLTEQRMHELAYYDTLTKLPNRSLFYDRLERELLRVKRDKELKGAVVFIDLDNFKIINDSYGHRVGDELLQTMAMRIKSSTRESDTISRLGGDEFTILITEARCLADIDITARRVLQELCKPVKIENKEFTITASLGVSVFPQDAIDGDALIKHADTAMYHAKAQGKNNIEYFTTELNQKTVNRMNTEQHLRRAMTMDELQIHFQPQINLETKQPCGLEVLARWQHPERGLLAPAAFIPIAEESNLINNISRIVINKACKQAQDWLHQDISFGRIAINISPQQFVRDDIFRLVRTALIESNLPPEHLELEITETVMMSNPKETALALNRIRDLGVTISIDDFGTGFSSLTHLKRLPLNRLKIDKSFILDILSNQEDRTITAAIIDLAHHLGLEVVAEGIETAAHLQALEGLGCKLGQGFYFSKPMAASDTKYFLQHYKR